MTDRSGQQLGNYRLIRLIGQGGFAEVYLGEHMYLQTEAAIKVMNTQVANDELKGFLNEARTIARLVHPHIVRVLEFGVEGITPFLVMDYAVNGSLRQRHPRGTRLSTSSIVPYVKQVAEALQYAHNEKLIHRDIKPENMLLGRHNEILLSDFGIALVAQSSRYQNTQDVIGTASYMAPEQIQGKPRPASDQYALGIVVYEWLSGDRPFHGSFTEIALQHVMAPPPPLREKVPELSPDFEQIVLTALAKDPHHRFMSVMAFANALEQASRPPPAQTTSSSRLSSFPSAMTSSSQSQQPTGHSSVSDLSTDDRQDVNAVTLPDSQTASQDQLSRIKSEDGTAHPLKLDEGISQQDRNTLPVSESPDSLEPASSTPSIGSPQSIGPYTEAPAIYGQQPKKTHQARQPLSLSPLKSISNFIPIISVFFLLAVLISSSIFYFARNHSNPITSNNNGTGSIISKVPITVGSKLDPEAQLLGEMYVLLLQKAGYPVNSKLALGQTPVVFGALKSGAIDLYPEFTGTGLNILGIKSTFNPDQDYQAVKNGFEQQYHITWLDQAPLNDGYALCTSQAESQNLGVTTLSQLAPKVQQLTLATQSDGVIFFDNLETIYGFKTASFKSVKNVDYSMGFAAVKSGAADVTECYTTDGSVITQGFIFLNDDKHGFTEFHPAPIVRDSVLQSDPGIKDALNKLAPYLTTQVSIDLQQQVATKHASGESISQAVKEVATSFLQSNGLL